LTILELDASGSVGSFVGVAVTVTEAVLKLDVRTGWLVWMLVELAVMTKAVMRASTILGPTYHVLEE